jgi:hypothetical protein
MVVCKIYKQIYKRDKMKNKTYHTEGTIPKSNRKNRRKMQNRYPYTQIHDCSLFWIGTGTSINSGGFKIFIEPKHPLLVKWCGVSAFNM